MSHLSDYLHLPLNVPVEMAAGSYSLSREDRLWVKGRELLCVVRDTDCIQSCCGNSPGFRSVAVPGYIVQWRCKQKDGLPVSIVERVTNSQERKKLARMVQGEYRVQQVEFM